MRRNRDLFVSGLLLTLVVAAETAGLEYVFPSDARIVNVRDHGAAGDGVTDDTAAIRIAVRTAIERNRYANPPFVYFPNGTYLVSRSIESRVDNRGWVAGWRAGMILVGQDRDRTVLRLADNLPDFGHTDEPRAVIVTGSEADFHADEPKEGEDGGGNRAFRHSIINLTVDTGKGNPGAAGIDFLANNRGSIEDVLIRDGDGSGVAGILMARSWPGPALIKRVEISGFAYGAKVGHSHYSMTMEHLTLRGQRKAGLHNSANILGIRGLRSDNVCPAVMMSGENGHISLVDSVLHGGEADGTAIDTMGSMLLRGVRIEGYGTALDDHSVADRDLGGKPAGLDVDFHTCGNLNVVGDSSNAFILPVEETPEFSSTDPGDWTSVLDYGAHPDDGWDDADAIQAAIDSGKPIVYLPSGKYEISRTIVVRGGVRKVMGTSASVYPTSEEPPSPVIRIEGGAGETVVFEHLWIEVPVEHASSKALAIRHCDIHSGYRNTDEGTGKLFLEDTIGKPIRILHPQSVWGRQVNTEYGTEPLIENHGGQLWILCQKTEGQTAAIATYGGRTELLAGQNLPLRPSVDMDIPCFINEGGAVSLCSNYSHGVFQAFIREGSAEAGSLLTRDDAPRPTTFYCSKGDNAIAGRSGDDDGGKPAKGTGFIETTFADATFQRKLRAGPHPSTAIRCDESAGPGEPRLGAAYVYTGILRPGTTASYRFELNGTRSDYDKRFFIDGKMILNNRDTPDRDHNTSAAIALEKDGAYPMKLELFIRGGHVWVPVRIEYTGDDGQKRNSGLASRLVEPVPLDQPTVSLDASDLSVREDGPPVDVRVVRDGGLNRPLELRLWSRGEAIETGACRPLPETIRFAAGQSAASFHVAPVNNNDPGGRLDLRLGLYGHADYVVTGEHIVLHIVDDESPVTGKGRGLQAHYFADTEFMREAGKRVDPVVDFDWTQRTALPKLELRKPVSVRWLGGLIPTYTEEYAFTVDGVPSARLWIGGELVIDARQQYVLRAKGRHALQAGKEVDIRLDVPYPGYGRVRLLWESPSQARQVIPAAQLNPEGFLGKRRIDLDTMDLDDLDEDDDLPDVDGLLPR